MQHRKRRVEALAERAPALINLPIPLPSIPLLDPILTPLIDGSSPASSTTTPSTPTTPASQPTTATQGASPSQTPSTATQPSNPQSPTTSPNASPTTGDGSGDGNGSTSGNGSNPDPSGSNPSSPSEPNPAGSTPSSGPSPSDGSSSVSGISFRPGGAVITISKDGQAFLSSSQSGSAGQETGGNASPNGATQASIPGYSGSASVTVTGSPTGATTGSTNINADPENPAQSGSTHHGLSGGVLAAIITVSVLLAFVLLLCCMRRRAIAARVRRRREWFAGGETEDTGYADRDSASTRSSFATHYDHGSVESTLPAYDVPSMQAPQTMQQIWPSDLSGSIVAVPAVSHAVESSSSPTIRVAADRSSIHSASSSPSRPSSQVPLPRLVVPPPAAEASSNLSPLSVRPYSPTESWWFPKPPKDDAIVGVASLIRTSSVTSSIQSHDTSFHAANPQNTLVAAENPFAEPEDPFADPATAAWPESPTVPSFPAIETVRHAFMPSMPDEMAISVGDRVRVIHGFDDGWATVQNVGTGAQGLVPLDRMRDDGKEGTAPAFLAKKRISSYVRPRDSAQTRASFLSGVSTIGAAI
ncbi:hypothetical protein GSI_15098 [Ganoderma sinense ZZ0214-1]|uniref:SH3 domain-containing protein n=1 Tax=Ganoderma sinense ZZ0214-1 TaxID=1077348 RepID=A0A2G8RLM8_9APHY|nr:hypothetical protein GSI_15098 [Ganoderma sinense ZZ0214-1]